LSASGDGTSIGLLTVPNKWPKADTTAYGTGLLDNARWGGAEMYPTLGRNEKGVAMYLTLAGNAVRTTGLEVSAGRNANKAGDNQSSSGCSFFGSTVKAMPCAESTSMSTHKLTFSAR
jgi:hypothetical protein